MGSPFFVGEEFCFLDGFFRCFAVYYLMSNKCNIKSREICPVNKPLKTVFLGSGDIAVPILLKLMSAEEIELAAVISQPDRPAGRKRIMTPTPLAQAAENAGLEVRKADDVNSAEFVAYLESLQPDLLCVVSFGQILKAAVLAVPAISCVNIHASLLPAYRGASPIVQAIKNCDQRTGVCFMEMERGLDSGPVYRTVTMELDGSEFADELEMKLGGLAAENCVETLLGIACGKYPAVPQDPAAVSVCRKICKSDGLINWNFPAENVEAMTRAYFPWPGAVAKCRSGSGKELNVTLCSAKIIEKSTLSPGECADVPGKLIVGCGNNSALEILELIPAGGKRMTAAAFRNGMRGGLPEFILPEPI